MSEEKRAEELALVAGCLAGDEASIRAFEDRYVSKLNAIVARIAITADAAADLVQRLREKLLVGDTPKLREFSGRGELGAWLRVVAVREALKTRRGPTRTTSDEEAQLVERAGLGDALDIRLAKAAHGPEVERAFRGAIQNLAPERRTLLRQHFLDGVSVDALAAHHGVHRVTVSRWLSEARRDIFSDTAKRLGALLRLSDSECRSLMRLVWSQMHVSRRMFA